MPDDILPLLRLDLNRVFDELDISLDRTVYIHSTLDLWHLLKYDENRTKNTAAIYMKGKILNIVYFIIFAIVSKY